MKDPKYVEAKEELMRPGATAREKGRQLAIAAEERRLRGHKPQLKRLSKKELAEAAVAQEPVSVGPSKRVDSVKTKKRQASKRKKK